MSARDRKEILDEAAEYVTKDRNSTYGEPEDNFAAIAAIWNAQGVRVKGKLCDPIDVALMMTGMKLARLSHDPTNRDSWADGIGYLACGYDVSRSVGVTDEQLIAPETLSMNILGVINQEDNLPCTCHEDVTTKP